jgi:hypothetical protein
MVVIKAIVIVFLFVGVPSWGSIIFGTFACETQVFMIVSSPGSNDKMVAFPGSNDNPNLAFF